MELIERQVEELIRLKDECWFGERVKVGRLNEFKQRVREYEEQGYKVGKYQDIIEYITKKIGGI